MRGARCAVRGTLLRFWLGDCLGTMLRKSKGLDCGPWTWMVEQTEQTEQAEQPQQSQPARQAQQAQQAGPARPGGTRYAAIRGRSG